MRPKDIGTAAESAVVKHLRSNGFGNAERRSLRGSLDAGDVTGTPGVCWEVKGGATARTASDAQVAAWLTETERERINARADIGILILQRSGIGPANAGRWWAVLWPHQFGWEWREVRTFGVAYRQAPQVPMRVHLRDACTLLRAAGYGAPLEDDEGGAA